MLRREVQPPEITRLTPCTRPFVGQPQHHKITEMKNRALAAGSGVGEGGSELRPDCQNVCVNRTRDKMALN